MGVLEELGLRPVINAAGPLTRMGGHRLAPEVAEAMAEAARAHLPIDELQERAGAAIAAATGAEAGYVTSGASAGLVLGTAACVAGLDPVLMDRLPDTSGMRNEVVVQREHRNAYDHAIRQVGVTFVEVGYLGFPGAGLTYGWQVEAALGPRTAAVAHPVQHAPGAVPLPEVAAIAHRHGIPVIVDAAAALPPVDNLRRFIREGADLVAFSGGKAIMGPQASGILAGRADLIRSVALQHQDMDVHPRTWRYRALIDCGELPGPPHHGIGRPMKVGKEGIVGLLAALRRFLAHDHAADLRRYRAILGHVAARLEGVGGVETRLVPESADGRPYPVLEIDLGGPPAAERAFALLDQLQAADPPVYLGQNLADRGQLLILPTGLAESEAEPLADALRAALAGGRVAVG